MDIGRPVPDGVQEYHIDQFNYRRFFGNFRQVLVRLRYLPDIYRRNNIDDGSGRRHIIRVQDPLDPFFRREDRIDIVDLADFTHLVERYYIVGVDHRDRQT